MRNCSTIFPVGLIALLLVSAAIYRGGFEAERASAQPENRFAGTIKPFLQKHCLECHGSTSPDAKFDLSVYTSEAAVLKDVAHLDLLIQRLKAEEMPPKKAKSRPTAEERREVVAWFADLREREMKRNAGDPGVVLARRLSNAEYNYTIRDLTGVDIKPTREFPVDPANTAGFDNSGETLVMSPALLNKYLKAAHEVASHMFLKPEGFAFAPHPMLVETDHDKYYVSRIIDFYHRQNIDYADYFQAAWRYKHRAALGKPKASLADIAADDKVSAKYLATIWATLEDKADDVGPAVKLQTMWAQLPIPANGQPNGARKGVVQMRDYVVNLRKKVELRFPNIAAGKVTVGSQPMMIWNNVQYATHRREFDPAQLQVKGEPPVVAVKIVEPKPMGEYGPAPTKFVKNVPGDPDLAVPEGQRARYEAAFAKFCSVFPDKFYMEERGRHYSAQARGRYLSAGFHSLMGYFRDDQPLYELILDGAQQKELDAMWFEMDFVGSATARMYTQFNAGGRQGGVKGGGGKTATPPAESKAMNEDVTTTGRLKATEAKFLANAAGSDEMGIRAIKYYFGFINDTVRAVEKAKLAAEPSHLKSLVEFAARAYRRPLSVEEKLDLRAYYEQCRKKDRLGHEPAMRESVVAVLMSPDFLFRFTEANKAIQPLSDFELANRLSYFLWSSMPDDELLSRAAAGDLHKPAVLVAQARRMLKDARVRGLAVEFGGGWLDIRRFEEIGTVDRDRFPSFTNELRDAMFEEPVRFLMDVIQSNRSILDCLYANDTFLNPVLAKHYGIPARSKQANEWVRYDDAHQFERGGLLPMAAFLTKNAPGLRTSPVKRGNWVAKNVLGERISPPPAEVPELPRDEAKLDLPLREVLARHRNDANCAACHARFDSLGLVFEGFGPIGERRQKDLAGRPIDAAATFPGGGEGSGLEGLRSYIRERRQNDFADNLCGKLLSYALGRSLAISDELTIQEMRGKLAKDGYRFDSVIESIVTSRQFLNKRGHE